MSIATGSTTLLINRNNIVLDSKGRATQLVDDLTEPRLRQIQDSSQSEGGDDQTSFRTARSRLSFRSFLTRTSLYTFSTGKQSQNGATWRQELVRTMDSGFGRGAPRGTGFVGDREGRERGGYLPQERGVGRIGRGPIPVPPGLARAALNVVEEEEMLVYKLIGQSEDLLQPFVESAKDEFERLKEWRMEIGQRLLKLVEDEVPARDVPYSFAVGIKAGLTASITEIGNEMEADIQLFERDPPYLPVAAASSEFGQEYQALELYRRLALHSIQLELDIFYPEIGNLKTTGGEREFTNSHFFGMAVFSAEASLRKLKEHKGFEGHSPYLADKRLSEHEKRNEYDAALGSLIQDLRKIIGMMRQLTQETIQERRAEMKSRLEKMLSLQSKLKVFVDKREFESIFQCYREIYPPQEVSASREQEDHIPSLGDEETPEKGEQSLESVEEILESLKEPPPSQANSQNYVPSSVPIDGNSEDGDWGRP